MPLLCCREPRNNVVGGVSRAWALLKSRVREVKTAAESLRAVAVGQVEVGWEIVVEGVGRVHLVFFLVDRERGQKTVGRWHGWPGSKSRQSTCRAVREWKKV